MLKVAAALGVDSSRAGPGERSCPIRVRRAPQPRRGSAASEATAQIQSLVNLGVPESQARHIFEVSARWTLAAVVAESAGTTDLFSDGLDLFLYGVRAWLLDRVQP